MGATTFSGPIKAGSIKNTTGTTVGTDVKNIGHVTMSQSLFVLHSNTSDKASEVVIPANSHIKDIIVSVEVAFTGTTNTLDVGIVGDSDKFVDNATLGTTIGTKPLGATAQCLAWKNVGTTDVKISAKFITSGGSNTAGKARITILYAQGINHAD